MPRPARSGRRGRPPKDASADSPAERNANAKKSKLLFAGSGRKAAPAAYVPAEEEDEIPEEMDDDCDESYTPVRTGKRGRPSRAAVAAAAAASASRSSSRRSSPAAAVTPAASTSRKRAYEPSDDDEDEEEDEEEEDDPLDHQDEEGEDEDEFVPPPAAGKSSDQDESGDEAEEDDEEQEEGDDEEDNDETEDEAGDEEQEEDDDGEKRSSSLRLTIRVPPQYLMEDGGDDAASLKNIPELILPESSDDLLIKSHDLMQVVSIYEILRHFSPIVRLTPFRFEDFCASLLIDEQSVLLSEIHMMLLKSLIREDETTGTHYTPTDLKDTVSINFFHTDLLTWPSALHLYLSADIKNNGDILKTCFQGQEYPFVAISSKIKVLSHLCDLFLQTNAPREDVIAEGIIKHDDNCRVCHKLGDLLCCETCPATFHLGCLDPPLSDVPTEEWICPVCRNSYVTGVSDCVSSIEKDRLLCRQEPLGWDRKGRRYWFLVRRIIVESEDGHSCWYYTTRLQLQLLINSLDDNEYESDLVRAITEQREEIERQMDITERLTNQAKAGKKTYLEKENDRILKILNNESVNEDIIDPETTSTPAIAPDNGAKSDVVKMEQGAGEDAAADEKMDEDPVTEVKPRIQTIESTPSATAATSLLAAAAAASATASETTTTSTLAIGSSSDTSNIDLKEELVSTAVSSASSSDVKKEETAVATTSTAAGAAVDEKKGILTRLKTGVIQPKSIVLDPLKRVNGESGSPSVSSSGPGDILIYSPDGESLTRISKKSLSANPALLSKFLFKLGMEVYVKGYVNLYNSSATSLSRLQHQEERDKKRHLSHKFSLTPASDFKWQSVCTGSRNNILQAIRNNLIHLEQQIPTAMIHVNWPAHRDKWEKAVRMCSTCKDFSLALCVLESCVKPVVFNQQWNDAIGFTHLLRLTTAEREESKKAEKKDRKDNDDGEGMYKYNVHVHYVFGKLKHQIWKQKGEEYRLSGKGGWSWLSRTRVPRVKRFVRPEPTKILELTEEQQFKVSHTPTISLNIELRRKPDDRIYYPVVYTGCWDSDKPSYTPRHKRKMRIMEGLLQRREALQEIQDRAGKEAAAASSKIEKKESADSGSWNKCYSPLCRSMNPSCASSESYCGCYSVICPFDVKDRENEKDEVEQEKLRQIDRQYEDSINVMGACRDRVYCHKVRKNAAGQFEEVDRIISSRLHVERGKLPPVHSFQTHQGKKKSILILADYELRKLARCASMREVIGFNYTCKLNHMIWPYHTTPRPMLRTSWLYRNQRIETIHQVALQLKVIWSSIRWDDLNQKPTVAANTITTETEVITTEILKRREIPPFGIRSEYQIRRIIVPIEMPSYKPREKATPIRSGLRERKRAESPQQRQPSMTETWHPEEELEIWELRQFGERLEKALKDKETRKSLEDQVKGKLSLEAAKREAARVSQARTGLISGNSTPLNSNVKNKISTMVQSRVVNASSQAPYAMIKTSGGQVYKVPLSALQGKSIGQQIIIKTGSVATAMTTTAATIMSMHTNPPIPTNSNAAAGTSTTQALVTPQATITPVAQAPSHNVIIRTATSAAGTPVVNKPIVISQQAGTSCTTTPVAGQQQKIVIRPNMIPGTNNSQQVITVPLKLPDGRTQMLQIPMSAFSQNQQVQIAFQTTPSVQSPHVSTIQVSSSATPAATASSTTTTPQQIRITSGPAVSAAVTPTPQRIIQIRQPGSAGTTTIGGQQVIHLSSGQAPQAIVAQNIVNQMKSGTIQLKLNPQPGTIVNAPGVIGTPAGKAPQRITIATLPAGNAVTAVSAGTPNVVRNPQSPLKAGEAAVALGSPSGGKGDFVLTSANVQDVLKKALLNQNLPHEVQQKIMSVQKNYQEAGQDFHAVPVPTAVTPVTYSRFSSAAAGPGTPTSIYARPTVKRERPSPVFVPFERQAPNPAAVARGKASALKRKQHLEEQEKRRLQQEAEKLNMSPEQREDLIRDEVCKEVMKGILDRIEKNERNEMKRRKTRESQMQQRWKIATTKLNRQVAMTADAIKKDILNRRSLLEKRFRDEAENELENLLGIKIKKHAPDNTNSVNDNGNFISKGDHQHTIVQNVIAAPVIVTSSNAPSIPTPLAEIHQPKLQQQQQTPLVTAASVVASSSASAGPGAVTHHNSSSPVKKTPNKRIKITPTKAEIAANAAAAAAPSSTKKRLDSRSPVAGSKSPAKKSPAATPTAARSPAKSSPAKKQQSSPASSVTQQQQAVPVIPAAKPPKLYCICQTAYDSDRFMVGCDTCHEWFHGDCIGIPESAVEEIGEWVCDKCKSEENGDEMMMVDAVVVPEESVEQVIEEDEIVIGAEPIMEEIASNGVAAVASSSSSSAGAAASGKQDQELFCLCRKPYDESQFYICCDNCQDWFHGRCVGVLQKEADTIETYICPNCKKDSGINHANLRRLETRDMVNLRILLSSVKQHKSAWPFLQPVSAKEVPDYYKVIKDPMDLKKIEVKLNQNKYTQLAQFVGDMTKIFDNCRYYNDRKSSFYALAESLEAFFVSKLKAFRENMS